MSFSDTVSLRRSRFRHLLSRYATVPTLLLAVFALSAAPSFAQQKWALLIGIDQYEDSERINALGAAANDANALAKTLREVGGFEPRNIVLLTSPGGNARPLRRNILRELEVLSRRVEKGDTVFVFFAGHGYESEGVPYLLPYDADITSPSLVRDTAVPVEKFRDYLKKLPARALILAFDMCRVDPDRGGRSTADANVLTDKLARGLGVGRSWVEGDANRGAEGGPRMVASLFACSPRQRSFEWGAKRRGYFSYYLEQGLRGAAAEKGAVRLGKLLNYLGPAVATAVRREEAQEQVPKFAVDGPGDAAEFALVEGLPLSSEERVAVVDTAARLRVTTNVPGALVYIDGVLKTPGTGGAIPLELGLETTRAVEVGVVALGYHTAVRRVTLRRGEVVPLSVALERNGNPAGSGGTAARKPSLPKRPLYAAPRSFPRKEAGLPPKPRGEATADDWYQWATVSSGRGAYKDACEGYTRALQQRPDFADAWFQRGLSFAALGQNGEAVQDFTQALARKPRLSDALVERGRAYAAQEQYDRACADYDAALLLRRESEETYLLRGDARYYRGDFDAAIEDYDRYQTVAGPRIDAVVYFNRASAWFQKRERVRALSDLDKFLALRPRDAQGEALRREVEGR